MDAQKIIFAGTPEFACTALKALVAAKFNVCAVYTQPDKPAGRGRQLRNSPVKSFAIEQGLPVYQPAALRDPAVQKTLSDLKPDLMIVAAYGLLLPPAVLTIPPLGCINIHASLLPKWRGAAPIQRAIMAGDTTTGITLMQMDVGLDTGAILLQAPCEIHAEETSAALFERLAVLGADTLLKGLDALQKNTLRPKLQDETFASYAAKISKSEGLINWENSAAQLDRIIRAFNPWPVAYSYLEGDLIRIWRAKALSASSASIDRDAPGAIVAISQDAIQVATGEGGLMLYELQMAGGKRLSVAEILHAKPEKFAVGKRVEGC
jgi:methionyl-tRNA formyltransferase